MNIILLGPPGSGKGTQAGYIKKKYNTEHVSTGDILRKEVSSDSDLGLEAKQYMDSGNLVPDQIIIEMVTNYIADIPSILLDGFPRTLEQARAFENKLLNLKKNINHVLYFELTNKTIIERLSKRITCRKCGKTYVKGIANLKCENGCSQVNLYQREDDKPQSITKRLEVYQSETFPLIDFYKEKNIFSKINANQSILKVINEIDAVLAI
ncbi:MAG: adenylate kinase [Chloroflexi bacterium]|nr:adenylate kinase [Chloroflexota bacterium]|tara:strand:+ start:2507 stop:3136 length:630 start_codon:yes stop_codon:yes gene_type:complete